MKLKSVFEEGEEIPENYTCDGIDINPPLEIIDVPDGAKSLALIVEDPDAPDGTWVHWVIWNIPPNIGRIHEGVVPAGAVQGMNDFRKSSYGGPCPPSGKHRYFFKLYALDCALDISTASTKDDLIIKMNSHTIDTANLMGTYERKNDNGDQ